MKVKKLNDITKTTKERPETFIALAGEAKIGNKLLSGLEIGTDIIQEYRGGTIIKPYMQVVPDMGIDSNYESFYYADNNTKEKYFDITTAMSEYNSKVLSKAQDSKEAEQYLINNIPTKKQELSVGYVEGEGYRSPVESCIILASTESQEQEGEFSTLIYKDGKFSVVDKVKNNRFGKLDLQSVNRPKFNIDDIQIALDEFAIRTKEETKEHSAEEIKEGLESVFEGIKTSDVKTILDGMENTKDTYIERE